MYEEQPTKQVVETTQVQEKVAAITKEIAKFFNLSEERLEKARQAKVMVTDKKTISALVAEGTVDDRLSSMSKARDVFLGTVSNKREHAALSEVSQLPSRDTSAATLKEQLDRELVETMGVYVPELNTVFVCDEYLQTGTDGPLVQETLDRVLSHELLHVLSAHEQGGGVGQHFSRMPLNEAFTEILRLAQKKNVRSVEVLLDILETGNEKYSYADWVKSLLKVLQYCNTKGADFSIDKLVNYYFADEEEDPTIMGPLFILDIRDHLDGKMLSTFRSIFDPPVRSTSAN